MQTNRWVKFFRSPPRSVVNIVDIVIVAILSLFAVRGYFRGLFREVFSLLGLFVGFIVAARYYEPVARLWQDAWQFSPLFLYILSFVALFFIAYLVLNVVGLLLHRSAHFLFLGSLNRLGGVAIGACKAAVVLGLLLFTLDSQNWIPENMVPPVKQAALYQPLLELGKEVVDLGRSAVEPASERESLHSNTRGAGHRWGTGFRQRL